MRACFVAFVRATRHVTDAEQNGSSFVFYLQVAPERRAAARGGARRSRRGAVVVAG